MIVANLAGFSRRYNKNHPSNTHINGGVQLDAGTLANCIVADNVACYDIGGVQLTGADAKMVNCLVVRNAGVTGVRQGVQADKGLVLNCTISGNGTNKVANAVACNVAASATFKNNIVWGNDDCATELTLASGATASNNCTDNPLFKNADLGNYRLLSSSPCVNAGDSSLWDATLNPVDLDGKSRVRAGVDIGCYECQSSGFVLFVR